MEKEKRIKKEKNRLKKIYKDLPEKEYATAIKLIDNVAFMVVTLEDLKELINNEELITTTVNASQTFKKENPALTAYNKMYANFLKGIQQLNSLLPEQNKGAVSGVEDKFMNFMKTKK